MFSRRHPFLFFMIVFAAIIMGGILGIRIVSALSPSDSGYHYPAGSGGEKIGVIEVSGVIAESRDIVFRLKRFREDDSIRAVVLRVDSPGGGAAPSQEICREVEKTAQKKKVVASMGAIATSGGYYIASSAHGIMANPGTITGSIGVIMGFMNYEELLKKIGLKSFVIKSGRYKDTGSPARPMRPGEKQILQDFSDSIHRQFIRAVARGRKMPVEKVEKISDGRIFSGLKAREIGLVDRMGNLEDAIQWAGEMSGAKGKITPIYPREDEDFFRRFLKMSAKEIAGRIMGEVAGAGNPRAGYLYLPPGE
ncbi:Signal peptidase [Candidatus Desulfarcum epimagneticum]|uniref:Signal peptidase n=1 Tax=uncultured Desulfobacteraceae bacterium TaxID=218296 RepID=A0A484HHJ1_9BACT|nr:Signal peptidase [uncultured Desulfobacteraceae bacterium]